MSKLYVFGIGGTGTRVLKSLVMLLASGLKAETDKIVPMVIDTDVNNGDLEYFRHIVGKYRDIHEKLYNNVPTNLYPDSFFRTEVEMPKELNISGTDIGTLANMIGYNQLNASDLTSTKGLIDLLFTEASREMNLEKGFLGVPSVGSIVLKQVVESRGFKEFTQEFKPGDRIFIISSIFGGTGAAGFPLLLNVFRDPKSGINNSEYIKDSIIGGISILPYFEVDSDKFRNGESAIDSNTFTSKTKAALAYYEKYLASNLNALFYTGDYRRSQYENFDGGENQKNEANFIEFASALSILEFIQHENEAKEASELSSPIKYFEFGISEDTTEINLTHLGKTSDNLLEQFIKFKYLSLYITNYLNDALDDSRLTWRKELQVPANFKSNQLVKDLREFCGKYYYRWLYQLGSDRHGRKFVPFNMNVSGSVGNNGTPIELNLSRESLFNVVNGIPALDNSNFFRKDAIDFDKTFTQKVDDITQNKELQSFEMKLIALLQEGSNAIYSERFKN
tara:strand:+ start:6660 stop:8180 length:1521 start_codon:yes stop_codon:yes gene_type:complete